MVLLNIVLTVREIVTMRRENTLNILLRLVEKLCNCKQSNNCTSSEISNNTVNCENRFELEKEISLKSGHTEQYQNNYCSKKY